MAGTYGSNAVNNRANTCPHGLPLGACPICNGMSGGNSTTKRNIPRREGEMTYNECFAQWQQMKRAAANKEARLEALENRLKALQNFKEKLIENIQKFSEILNKIQADMPKPIALAVQIVSNVVIKPILKVFVMVVETIQNLQILAQNVRNAIISVSEKLSAILGEVKNFLQKQIFENSKQIKKHFKKLLSVFGLFEQENEEDEEIKDQMRTIKEFEIEKLSRILRKLLPKDQRKIHLARDNDKNNNSQIQS